jgi:hypothetical protein
VLAAKTIKTGSLLCPEASSAVTVISVGMGNNVADSIPLIKRPTSPNLMKIGFWITLVRMTSCMTENICCCTCDNE